MAPHTPRTLGSAPAKPWRSSTPVSFTGSDERSLEERGQPVPGVNFDRAASFYDATRALPDGSCKS